MTLTRCSDLAAAGWLTAGDRPWEQLVGFGPAGFPAYARLRFLPDPAHEGQSENDLDLDLDLDLDDAAASQTAQLRAVLDVLAEYTRTPDHCYFCLWDGWDQQVRASDREASASTQRVRIDAEPGIDPSFSAKVPYGPMVVVPNRSYLLFHGSLSDLGDWSSAAGWPGQPGAGPADPAFVWPADRAWCVANDVDPHWAGIGADAAAIDRLVADPRLDVVRADPGASQPRYS